MYRRDVPPSGLPSLMLPCTQCGHKMMFAARQPARLANGAASNDLEDAIYRCEQCSTTLIRTMRSPSIASVQRPAVESRFQ
jgi:DNA-directed RNA polymerase subunit RPC12/RpoP